jgi:glucose-1-phosphate thymidylyltransferase
MIYYPLSVLMLAGIREILIISTPHDLPRFEALLGNGAQFGVSFSYMEQPYPGGLAQAFILGKEFIGNDSVCLILGDNIFFGHDLQKLVKESIKLKEGGIIFGYAVKDPERYGVVSFDKSGTVTGIEEKPHSINPVPLPALRKNRKNRNRNMRFRDCIFMIMRSSRLRKI